MCKHNTKYLGGSQQEEQIVPNLVLCQSLNQIFYKGIFISIWLLHINFLFGKTSLILKKKTTICVNKKNVWQRFGFSSEKNLKQNIGVIRSAGNQLPEYTKDRTKLYYKRLYIPNKYIGHNTLTKKEKKKNN